MYLPFVLKFYNLRMAVRVKICATDTINGTLGIEWRFGNELTGSGFSLGYIEFALSSGVQHRIREVDHSSPSKTEEKNEWNHTSTHFHTAV